MSVGAISGCLETEGGYSYFVIAEMESGKYYSRFVFIRLLSE